MPSCSASRSTASWCHSAFHDDRQARLPTARRFRAEGSGGHAATASTAAKDGTTERALFVIDAGGVVRWSYVSPIGVNPGADGILHALTTLTAGAGMNSDEDPVLTPPVGADDHVRGRAPRSGHAGGVRRFPVPLLRGRLSGGQGARAACRRLLRVVFRNFPLSNMHPHAEGAAEAAEAAGAQGKFWEMHDMLFEHQRRLDRPGLVQLRRAGRSRLSPVPAELEDGRWTKTGARALSSGVMSGVNGTPTFFLNGRPVRRRLRHRVAPDRGACRGGGGGRITVRRERYSRPPAAPTRGPDRMAAVGLAPGRIRHHSSGESDT